MDFSEEFSKILSQSNTAIYSLSKSTGIDRRAIYRLKDGTKKPTFEEYSKIVKALSITKEEKNRLWKAYEITTVGKEKFNNRKRTKEFLETLGSMYDHRSVDMVMLTKSEINLKEETTTLQGSNNVNALLRNVMSLENATNGFIFIQSDLSFEFLFDELAFQINCNSNLDAKVFLALNLSDKALEESFYNESILSMTKIYPLFLMGEKFDAKYVKVTSKSNALFPHNIVTSHYFISVSQDKNCAIITSSKKILQSTKDIFLDVFSNGTSFIQKLDIDNSVTQTLMSLFHMQKNPVLYSMDYEPCVTILADRTVLENQINRDNENAIEIMEIYTSLRNKTTFSIKSFFTLEGLRDFLETGVLFGVPLDYYHPLNTEMRIRIINNMYTAYKDGWYTPYLINNAYFNYPKNFRYSGSGTIYDYYFITLNNENDIFNTMTLNENGMSSYFYDFVQSLPQTEIIFSPEESMNIILEETEKILDCKIQPDEQL